MPPALTIKRTGSQEYGRYIKALICGDPGTGKTLISSTFPNPLYLTTEGLMMSVADRDVPYQKLEDPDQLLFIVKMLQQKASVREKQFGFPVDTIIVDTIDDVSRMILRERMRSEKHESAQLQDYGYLKEQMAALTTALRNLDMNVVLTCHLKTREVNGLTQMIPAVEGGFSSEIAGYVDLAVVLKSNLVTKVVGTGTERGLNRFMLTIQDPQHGFIKDHSGKLPAEFPINFKDDYDRLMAIVYPNLPEVEETVPEAATVPEPVEPTPEGELPLAEPTVAADARFTCDKCGTGFDDEEQRDRSKIKFRRAYCTDCFDAAA